MQVIRSGLPQWGAREQAYEHGREYWFNLDIIPTVDDNSRVTGVMLVINNITESVQAELALRESEARYRAFIANSSDAIWCFEVTPPVDVSMSTALQVEQIIKRSTLSECNLKLAELFGCSTPADVVGMPLHRTGSLSSKHDVRIFVEHGYKLEEQEYSRVNGSGERRYMQSSAIGILENGRLVRAWGVTRDVTTQRSYVDHMEYLANHDSLTRLPNRALLYKTIESTIKSSPSNRPMALMLIDLDRFKEINDTLGHRAGDTVLQQLGPRLEMELSETEGMVARLGGDEFAVFLPRIRNQQQAIVLGHRFLDCLTEPFEIENIRLEIGASIGISFYPVQAEDLSTLMRYADVAMYHAKTAHKGVSVYDTESDPHSPTRLELISDLRQAIAKDQLQLYFQPKIDLLEHKISGFEALLRWPHPSQGMIPPMDFVEIAEKSNMIYPLTCWVMDNAIQQCAQWRREGYELRVAINLSPRNLSDERLLPELKRLLFIHQLPGEFLEMEITESVIMADPERAMTAMASIAELGVRFSIDDYGTGYSSLAYLKKLPVYALKIDKSFVLSMLDSEQDDIIVSSTIKLAHNLGISVVAEGVESEKMYQRLSALECDCAQGFYMAKPMCVDAASTWLEDSEWSASLGSA
ncbi:diguanylate cyclase (GGDEF) domain-containing protein [Alteromonadaceae bacterium Bs31]|nr:diguanylate cyclase (GGDEF) domain-containing protein [Alteromonadaceae bacterium Bs31]